MESRHGAHEASKFAPEDFISNMPDFVITNILDRLPLQDAVGTSVLSRNWRFKWTTLSQLVFDFKFYEFLKKTKHEKDYERIISRFLLHLQGPITNFTLYTKEGQLKDEDIAHWILFLSRKGVKDLSMWKNNEELFDVPTHIFSCLELKHLSLCECRFYPPASFHGFPNLLSLELFLVEFEIGKFGELFTQCPVLEVLNLADFNGKVKLSEIKKLTNLKILNLFLGYLDTTEITSSSSSIFELLGFLPKLQELYLDFRKFKFTEDGSRKRSLTNFPCLRKLKLSFIDLCSEIMLPFAFDIIKSFPNLQTLEISADARYNDPPHAICSSEVDCNTIGLLKLRSVVFTDLKDSTNEVCLVEYVLACSPFLKKVVIRPHSTLGSDKEKLKFAKKLLELHRASPVAEIKLE